MRRGDRLPPEDERTEYKRSTAETKAAMTSLAAMLNKHGRATVHFGVADDGTVIGQKVGKDTLRRLHQAIRDSIDPAILPEVTVTPVSPDLYAIRIEAEGDRQPYAARGTYRIRMGDEDVVMSQPQVLDMAQEALLRDHPWDQQPSPMAISDIDERELMDYVHRGNESHRIAFAYTGIADALSRLGLLVEGRLTNAAAILFCPSPTDQLKMAIFADRDRSEPLDIRHVSGTFFELVNAADAYLGQHMRRKVSFDGSLRRVEKPSVPYKALREALLNAFTHRDWRAPGYVNVEMYQDSIAIESPGWFIMGEDPAEHLSGRSTSSRTRNGLIAKTVFRSGEIESEGLGIPMIKALCDESGVDVSYERTTFGTRIEFWFGDTFGTSPGDIGRVRRRRQSGELEPRANGHDTRTNDRNTLSLVASVPTASLAQIAERLQVSPATVARSVRRLKDAGLLVREGSRRYGRWVVLGDAR